MKLGISTYAFAWSIGVAGYPSSGGLDAVGFVRRAAELGVHIVQIADNLPLDRLTESQRAELRRISSDLGIEIEVGTRGLLEENLTSYLDIAREMGSPILRVVPDLGDFRPTAEEMTAILRRIVPLLDESDVILAVENHDRLSSSALASVIRAVASPRVGICLDTVNSFGALDGPAVVVETLGPLAVNLHLKDFSVERVSHKMGFVVEGVPAGEGRLDIPWLLERLRSMGREMNAILEVWVPPEQSIEATITKEQAWAKRSVHYLRTLIAQ